MAESTWLTNPALLEGVAKRLESEHASRQAESKTYLRCYWDRPVVGRDVDYTRPYRELAVFEALKSAYGGNLTREVVDAAVSILCRQLSPRLIPKGADFELVQGCKQATRLIEGVFDNSNFLGVAKRAIRDGATADMGPVKGFIDPYENEIKFERVNPLSLFWVDNGTDDPRTLVQMEAVDRQELMDRYPQHAKGIKDARRWSRDLVVGVDLPGRASKEADTVKFVEAWATKRGEKNGAHQLMVGDVILDREEWTHSISPIFRFLWSDDFSGYGGVSLARVVNRYDIANRRLLRMVYASLAGAVPQILKHVDTTTDGPSDLEYGQWEWEGTVEPKLLVQKVVNPDLIDRLDRNYARAYAEAGVNQNMATGSAPARYTSGAAQREFVDIANTRLLDAQQQVEKLWRDGAEVVIMLAEQAKKTHVKVRGANYYESVSFPKLGRDKFKTSMGLSSGLSLTPSGRKQDLADLQQMGLIDLPEMARSLNLPDLEATADRLNAPRDLIMQQISICLDQGPKAPFPMPSAMMDLNAAVKAGGDEWQRAHMQGNYPPENVEMLRRWISACRSRLAPPPAMPAAPMGQMLAGPGPAATAPAPVTAPPPAVAPAMAVA